MPIPSPKGPESKNDFVSRCIASPTMQKEYKNRKQLIAICETQYRRAKKAKASEEEPKWSDFEDDRFLII